ncbi:MAG: hypothetical protein F4Y40_01825 [Acidimicrobiia bacterium]|nr:hypothetical protein [Acidimicrobiia bacterium]MYF84496.1 hypothetical protein [Acidimicrobiia bacterium]
METKVLADSLDDGIVQPPRTPDPSVGDEVRDRTDQAEHRPVESPEPSGLVAIQIISMGGPADPVLADLMEKAFEAADRRDRLRYGPEWRREAAEGFRKLMEEWQAENGAFTKEELRRGRAILGRP